MKNPACELWDRENDEQFRILYHTCMLHTVCSNNFVRSTAVESAATVRTHLISYATGARVGRKRGYVAH